MTTAFFIAAVSAPAVAQPFGASLFFGNLQVGAAADTRYLSPGYENELATTDDRLFMIMPFDGEIRNLYVRLGITTAGSNDIIFEALLGTSLVVATVTMNPVNSSGQAVLVAPVPFLAGNVLQVRVRKPNATTLPGLVVAAVGVVFNPPVIP
jgi:hypothetical protein